MRALLAVLLLGACPVSAHEAGAPHAEWYRALTAPDGSSCCNMHDCAPVAARIGPNGWQANVAGEWLDVPDGIVLPRHDNPTGEAVLCRFHGEMRCFVPGVQT